LRLFKKILAMALLAKLCPSALCAGKGRVSWAAER
jgi:hypothetical protein